MSRFEYTIENVLDIPLWEKMQDRLAELTGTAIVCIDIKGKPVTKHSGRTAFCSIVRENPVSRKRCFRCDALAGVEAVRRGRPYIYLCHCGIVDVAVPVMVGDIYLGAVMFGQVRLRHKDREKAERFMSAPKDYGRPWFGQLMAGPQMLAYLVQLNAWMVRFGLTV